MKGGTAIALLALAGVGAALAASSSSSGGRDDTDDAMLLIKSAQELEQKGMREEATVLRGQAAELLGYDYSGYGPGADMGDLWETLDELYSEYMERTDELFDFALDETGAFMDWAKWSPVLLAGGAIAATAWVLASGNVKLGIG